jgi:hypothetical protein
LQINDFALENHRDFPSQCDRADNASIVQIKIFGSELFSSKPPEK